MILALCLGITWFLAVGLAFLDGRNPWVGRVAVAGLAAQFGALAFLASTALRGRPVEMVAGGWPVGIGITLRADALGIIFALLATAVLLVSLLFELLRGIRGRFFPVLVLFLATGLAGLFLTGDAFNFYVFFEISMTAAFVLTSYGGQARQLRATLIFVAINLLGSVTFLVAVGALYRVTGTLDMVELAVRVASVHPNALALIGALILAAFSLKIGLFPFHTWLPPVYVVSSPAVAAILSGALANIGSYGLLRFGGSIMPGLLEAGAPVLLVLGSASIVYGALLAFARFPTREVLAYSAIGQAGYIMIAVALGGPVGFGAAVLYSVVNSLNKTVLFLATGLRGWLMGGAFAIGAFSVAGVPPAAGFMGKVAVLKAGIMSESIALVSLMILGSALSFIYAFRTYQRDYWIGRAGVSVEKVESPILIRGLVLLVAGAVLAVGIWPEPLLYASGQAAVAVTGGNP